MKTLFMIGNTHFDPVWLWTWDEAMASIRATFRSALDRMKEDPDFTYSFCTPPVFEWIKQTDPEMFEEIKLRASQGRWDVSAEGWWLQPDCNNLSGESLIRQGVYGQRYVMENFGKYATSVLNIDSFGHSAAIPQIMTKCGLKYYMFARPNKNELSLDDNLFKWTYKDGSEVLAYRFGSHDDGEIYPLDTMECIDTHRKIMSDCNHDLMLFYGVTDHGGAPTKKAIKEIHNAQDKYTDISIEFSSVDRFFSAQTKDGLISYSGELQTMFYGPFSNTVNLKQKNRKAEYSIVCAEAAAWMSLAMTGRKYPQNELYGSWKDIMFNQFHDILGGATISEAVEDALNLYGRSLQVSSEIINYSLQSICRRIKTLGDNQTSVWNLCIFNLTGADFSGFTEAEVQWAWEFPWYSGSIELEDEKGYIHSAQIIQTKSSIPGFRSRFVFKAEVPAMGYRTYAIKQAPNKKVLTEITGDISSPFCFRVYEDAGDVWCFNTSVGYGVACEDPILKSSQMVEIGEIRNTLKQVWSFRESILEEYITVYRKNGETEYRYNINWNEKHKVLKLLPTFCKDINELTVSVPCGVASRSFDGREYPSGEWMVLPDTTLLFDGIFAYDTVDSDLRLTVVRSPIVGDLRTEPLDDNIDYKFAEQGVHSGRIRLIPQKLSNNRAANRFAQWIIPPKTVCEANHDGDLPPVWQGLSLNGTAATVTALKRAEDMDAFILRLAKLDGQKDKFSVRLGDTYIDCIEINPYEIKTLCFDLSGKVFEADLLEKSLTAI